MGWLSLEKGRFGERIIASKSARCRRLLENMEIFYQRARSKD